MVMEKTIKNPYRKSIRLILIDLARIGIEREYFYDKDFYVCLAQYFFRLDCPIQHCNQYYLLRGFFANILFNYEVEGVIYSHRVINWRNQINLYTETLVKGLKFYRSRSVAQFKNETGGLSISQMERLLCEPKPYETLNYSPNESHKDAIYILSKNIFICKNHFEYSIRCSTRYEYEESQAGRSSANWGITVRSENDENYFDFIFRLTQARPLIFKGSSLALSLHFDSGADTIYKLKPFNGATGEFLTRINGNFALFEKSAYEINDKIAGRLIEDFALSAPNIALEILQKATKLDFKEQDIKPNLGEYFMPENTPEKISWSALVLNDAIPCSVTFTFDYVSKEWDWQAKCIDEKGNLIQEAVYLD